MGLRWVWPQLSGNAAARQAVRNGFWACVFIAVVNSGIGAYAFIAHRLVFGYFDAWALVDGAFFAIIAWRLRSNSRAWAVIGLVLMGFEVTEKLRRAANTFGVITVLLFLALLNATRGTFALHRWHEQESSPVKPQPRASLGWIWTMPDKGSARRAIKGGCWACAFLAGIYFLWGTYTLASHRELAGWGMSESWFLAANGALFVIVAWRLWRNSRVWALLGLIVMGAEFASAQISLGRPNMFVVLPATLFLAMVNATRGAFVFQRYSAHEQPLGVAEQNIAGPLGPRV